MLLLKYDSASSKAHRIAVVDTLRRFSEICASDVHRANSLDPAYIASASADMATGYAHSAAASHPTARTTISLLPVSGEGSARCAHRCVSFASGTGVALSEVNEVVLRPALDSMAGQVYNAGTAGGLGTRAVCLHHCSFNGVAEQPLCVLTVVGVVAEVQ